MLQQLIRLASDQSLQGRTRLLHAVTELFLADRAPSNGAGEHFSGIANAVLERMPENERASYAKRVAPEALLPSTVAKNLAADPSIAVAREVLRLSPALSDDDLVALLSSLPSDRWVAVAERPALSEGLTDALVDKGDQAVLRTVSGNHGARFSETGLSALLKHSAADAALMQNLMKRIAQLPAQQAKQIQAAVSPPTRPAAGATPVATPMPVSDPRKAKKRQSDAKSLLAEIKAGGRTADEAVELLAGEDRAFDLARVISVLGGLPEGHVLKALLDSEAGGIAAACRAAKLSERGYRGVLALRGARLQQTQKQLEREVEAYLDADPVVA
jgi:uncharacterized protein (DUF2336 family)